MSIVVAYNTPGQFLEFTQSILEQRELENNLILGLCNNFEDKNRTYEGCIFINVLDKGQVQATSIITKAKAIITGATDNPLYVKALADYYSANQINLAGVVGENFYARRFAQFYGSTITGEKELIVHQLTTVNKLPPVSGYLIRAENNDIDLLTEWTLSFEADSKIFPRQSKEQARNIVEGRIAIGTLYKWIDNNEIVSIAGLIRKTRNAGIVGLVYTPNALRGKGYATACVQQLSTVILQSGFKYCGLFTDKSNPTSNHIYRKIGYMPLTEFVEIQFS